MIDRVNICCGVLHHRSVLQAAFDDFHVGASNERSPRIVPQHEGPDAVAAANERACQVGADPTGGARHQHQQVKTFV